jgi:hypothetical protein
MFKLSRGGIAGIVVGCALVLLAILLCFYELHLRKKARLAAPGAGLSVPGASNTAYEGGSYELGLGYAIPSHPSYGRPTFESSPYAHPTFESSPYAHPTFGSSPYGRPIYFGADSTSEQKVREVRPDPVGGEVWMPRLFEKVRVRLKTIQDDPELV